MGLELPRTPGAGERRKAAQFLLEPIQPSARRPPAGANMLNSDSVSAYLLRTRFQSCLPGARKPVGGLGAGACRHRT